MIRTEAETEKRAAMEAVAKAWNDAGITYSVAHGVERYPEHLGRDLDVVFTVKTLIPARDCAIRTLEQSGWKVAFASREWAWWIFAFQFREEGIISLEIDLLPWLQAGFTRIVEQPQKARHRFQAGPFWTDPWASVAKRLVFQAFSGNFKRFEKRPWELKLSPDEADVLHRQLPEMAGASAAAFISALEAGDVAGMRAATPALKQGMMRQALKGAPDLFDKVRFTLERFWKLNLFPQPAVPIVVLVGPDGVGKSTVLHELKQMMEQELVFPSVLTRHWRPKLFPDLSDLAKLRFRSKEDVGPRPPRRDPGRGSFIRAFYYTLDFILGHRYRDCRESVRLNAILYDRHAVDMVVNPQRYGIRKMPGFLFRLIPRPDYIVALVDTPDRIIARKAELEPKEIEEQVAHWEKLHREGVIDDVIHVDALPPVLARRIMRSIVQRFCERNLPPRR